MVAKEMERNKVLLGFVGIWIQDLLLWSVTEARDRWAPGWAFTTGLLFTLPGVRRRWAPGWTFITSALFTFPKAREKWAPGLHIYDRTPVYVSRSAPQYKNQQQK